MFFKRKAVQKARLHTETEIFIKHEFTAPMTENAYKIEFRNEIKAISPLLSELIDLIFDYRASPSFWFPCMPTKEL